MQKKYMETLLAQIRDKRARECVRLEIEGHIKEQKISYMAGGMPEEQAEEKAVADMGDPVEAGSALDQLHRPKPAWGALAIIAVLCAAGVVLQYAAYMNYPSSNMGNYYFQKQCQHAVLGFLILCGVYLMDYTRIARYSRYLCTGIILALFLAQSSILPLQLHSTVHSYTYLAFWGTVISADMLFYLYLPLYGAVLYSYRNSSAQNLGKVFLYTILPIYLAFRYAHLAAFLNVTVILLLMLGTAASQGWFPVSAARAGHQPGTVGTSAAKCMHGFHKRPFIKFIGMFLSGSIILFALSYPLLNGYQKTRIQAWLNPSAFHKGAGYICSVMRSILNASQLIGKNTEQAVNTILPNYETDFFLTYIIGTFGILAAAAIVILVIMLGAKLLHISFRQKNQLGMMMGIGCSLAFVIQSAEYILVNLTILPAGSLYFPLISYGGSGMLQTCILLGILLSIYRYENMSSCLVQDFTLRRKVRKNV